MDNYPLKILPLGVNKLMIIESYSHMRDLFASKEDQITFLRLRALNYLRKKVILLIGISRDDMAAHTIAKLYQSTTIDTAKTRAPPEIRHIQKCACVVSHHPDILQGIQRLVGTYNHTFTRYPTLNITWQSHMETMRMSQVNEWQHR